MHGTSLCADQVIRAGDAKDAASADVVCITAGSRRKPDESRPDLINRNVSIFRAMPYSRHGSMVSVICSRSINPTRKPHAGK